MTTCEVTDTVSWDDLVSRLSDHDIRYLMGGETQVADRSAAAPIGQLILDLARSDDARLRDALIALLLRHPDVSALTEGIARGLALDDPARRFLLVCLVVAAALQGEWAFSLDLYIRNQIPIAMDHVAAELGLPEPGQDFGRPCLKAAAELLRRGAPFPFNYCAGWQDVVHRLLAQLALDARRG